MKILLAFILLIISLSMVAQKDSTRMKVTSDTAGFMMIGDSWISQEFAVSVNDTNYSRLSFNLTDSTIEIYGDTAKLLWMMLKYMNEKDSVIMHREKVIQASVDHTNMVSDYFKTKERKWPQYKKLLNQMGYTTTKRKK